MNNINSIELINMTIDINSLETKLDSYLKSIKNNYVKAVLEIVEEDVSYYIRLEGSTLDKNCIILYNGAVDIDKKDKPVFQRSSWVNDIEGFVINIDDPTVRLRKDIVLGWGQGKIDNYFSIKFNIILQKILMVMSFQNVNRIHFGSSAGGYQAIVGAALDKGSRAIVCNPQIDWTHHFFEKHITKIREVTFKNYSVEAIRSMYLHRLNAMEMAIYISNIPSVDYYVNSSFTHDMNNQLRHFIDSISSFRAKRLLEGKEMNIHVYHDEKNGHNPPSKYKTISFIKKHIIL